MLDISEVVADGKHDKNWEIEAFDRLYEYSPEKLLMVYNYHLQ